MKYRTLLVSRAPRPGISLNDTTLEEFKDSLLAKGTITVRSRDGGDCEAEVIEAHVTDKGVEVALQMKIPIDLDSDRKAPMSMGATISHEHGGCSGGCGCDGDCGDDCQCKETTP